LSLSVSTRFSSGVIYNLISFGVIGVSGFLLNALIGRIYGEAALGQFSQVFAAYLILSQLAVGGFYFSTLRFVSEHIEMPQEAGAILNTALLLGLVQSIAIAGATWLAAPLIGRLLDSPNVTTGLYWITPALVVFALNKILFAAANGLQQIGLHALFQGLRFVFVILSLVGLIALDGSPAAIPVVFTIAEAVLFVLFLLWFAGKGLLRPPYMTRAWLTRHVSFGRRVYFSGLLFDINTKVDIIMLGYFTGDAEVGIYAFAALLAEGFGQLTTVLQTSLNPLLVRLKAEGRQDELPAMVRRCLWMFTPAMAAIAVVASLLFPFVALLLTGNSALAEGVWIFAILCAGTVIAAAWLPFNMLLSQWGHPKWQTALLLSGLGTNVALNLVLIPLYGGLGAAIATASATVAMVLYMKAIVFRLEQIRI
jgi:O-antigen/teichoic acid export membrane protein